MSKKEVFFIFKDEYFLTKNKTWSLNFADADLMSEQEASDTCQDYDKNAGCGSKVIDEEEKQSK